MKHDHHIMILVDDGTTSPIDEKYVAEHGVVVVDSAEYAHYLCEQMYKKQMEKHGRVGTYYIMMPV